MACTSTIHWTGLWLHRLVAAADFRMKAVYSRGTDIVPCNCRTRHENFGNNRDLCEMSLIHMRGAWGQSLIMWQVDWLQIHVIEYPALSRGLKIAPEHFCPGLLCDLPWRSRRVLSRVFFYTVPGSDSPPFDFSPCTQHLALDNRDCHNYGRVICWKPVGKSCV